MAFHAGFPVLNINAFGVYVQNYGVNKQLLTFE